MRALLATALGLILLGVAPALAGHWRITKDHWSQADEDGFGRFVTTSCLRSPANPWAANEDRGFLDVDVDCAKLPHLLRTYYSWKNGLPFSYVNAISGDGDVRFSKSANVPVLRTDIVDHGGGIDGPKAMREMLDTVFTATYRTDAGQTRGVPSDFYSPRHPARQHPAGHRDRDSLPKP